MLHSVFAYYLFSMDLHEFLCSASRAGMYIIDFYVIYHICVILYVGDKQKRGVKV